jgi:hypothetical protein
MADHSWSVLAADSKQLVKFSGGVTMLLMEEAVTNHSRTN